MDIDLRLGCILSLFIVSIDQTWVLSNQLVDEIGEQNNNFLVLALLALNILEQVLVFLLYLGELLTGFFQFLFVILNAFLEELS